MTGILSVNRPEGLLVKDRRREQSKRQLPSCYVPAGGGGWHDL
jgi:hypothetical protein